MSIVDGWVASAWFRQLGENQHPEGLLKINHSRNQMFFQAAPLLVFSAFLIENTLWSYGSLSWMVRLETTLLGLMLPVYLYLRHARSASAEEPIPMMEEDGMGMPPAWLWILVFLAAGFLRFYDLVSGPVWPNTDESYIAQFASNLREKWTWRFFYTFGQTPPGMIWWTRLFLDIGRTPLESLWLGPAVLSFTTTVVVFFASRKFFPKRTAFMFWLLFSLGFWPLYAGRYCHQGALLPIWVFSVLWLWGEGRPFESIGLRRCWAFGLGSLVGLGSLTFTPWPVLVLWMTALWVFYPVGKKERSPGTAFYFTGLFLALIPFLGAGMTEGFGKHIWSVSSARGYMPWLYQASTVFSYFTGLVWGIFQDDSAYGPVWGGFWNPVSGSLLMLGVVDALRFHSRPQVRWVLFGAFLCFLPGLLSMNVEMYRILLVLPFFLAATVWGLWKALLSVPARYRTALAVLLVGVSVGLDAHHLSLAGGDPWRPLRPGVAPLQPGKPQDTYQAYRTLQEVTKGSPILFFSDFIPLPSDGSLAFATSDRNPLLNRHIPLNRARWAAVMVNANEVPFLKDRFADSRWIWLNQGQWVPDGGWALGFWPVTDVNRSSMTTWAKVHETFRALDIRIMNLSDGEPGEPLLAQWNRLEPLLGEDRFLWSCYWRKVRALCARDRDYRGDVEAIRMAQTRGYPSADLDYLLGSIQMRKKEFVEARKSLHSADRRFINLTSSKAALTMLDRVEADPSLIVEPPPQR